MGGLGNQLFQYAAGRALALRLNTALKLDHTFLETDSKGAYTQRHFELDIFNCAAEKASAADLAKVRKAENLTFLTKLFARNSFTIFKEKGFSYNTEFEQLEGDVYLSGFWQSEKYFARIRQTLLNDLTLRLPLSAAASCLKQEIAANATSVSVHFRRGDYVSLQPASDFHGAAEMAYYQKSLDFTRAKLAQPAFYIFSDDIEWVKANFKVEGALYVSGLKAYEDLELMKSCRHNIIANSSFSWWGAWLNQHGDKTVVAPKKWFKDASINTIDLIPAGWHSV